MGRQPTADEMKARVLDSWERLAPSPALPTCHASESSGSADIKESSLVACSIGGGDQDGRNLAPRRQNYPDPCRKSKSQPSSAWSTCSA
jgi:hypothetical protein